MKSICLLKNIEKSEQGINSKYILCAKTQYNSCDEDCDHSRQPMADTGHLWNSYEAPVLHRNSGCVIQEYWEETQDTAVGSTAAHVARKMDQRRISYEYLSLPNP